MPFRTKIKGLPIECDTLEELDALAKRYMDQAAAKVEVIKEAPREKPLVKPTVAAPVPQVRVRPPYQPIYRRGFVGMGKLMLEALKEVYPSPITSPRLVARMGIKGRSFPAIIMGLRSRATHEGLNFDELVKSRMGLEDGKTVTTYQITEQGIEALQKYSRD